MQEVRGAAAFESFPDESFRFGVGHTDDTGEIWLENQTTKKRWTCKVIDVAAFAPADVVLPQKTVLHYVAASLKESAANRGAELIREEEDKTLRLEVLIKLGVADLHGRPTQVQGLQEEVKTLKEQMQSVVQAQRVAQPAQLETARVSAASSLASPPAPSVENRALHRGNQVWRDIIRQSQHKLVQTEEYRETRNQFGVIGRSHRQRTCKVCSVLRGSRKRASLSSYYCTECTERHEGGMVFLCDKSRPHDLNEYQNATCSQIWHLMWNNGEDIPQTGKSSIRMRKKLKPSPSESETSPTNAGRH